MSVPEDQQRPIGGGKVYTKGKRRMEWGGDKVGRKRDCDQESDIS